MFNNTANIQKLTAEVLVNLASFLEVATLLQLSLTCKSFSHLIKDELVFRQITNRDYRVTEKEPEQTWVELYQGLHNRLKEPTVVTAAVKQEQINDIPTPKTNTSTNGGCTHLIELSETLLEAKRIIYKNGYSSVCDICSTEPATFLNMSVDNHNEACLPCLKQSIDDEDHFPIQLELESGDLYCFKCGQPHKLTESKDGETVKTIVDYIKSPESEEDLDKRRKAEHQLYVQELRREDMQLKHYLVEKQWGRTWMLFRTREGSPLPTKITNQKLARMNGTLDPNIRLPMDKYRPSPETHGDIVSEKLWSYLVKAYGVQGRAYSEDDIIAPEYARLRVYVDDFKKSIHLYS